MAVEILSSFLFTPFLIRSFGQAEYGVYSLSISITSYLTLLDLGIGNAIVRYISKYRVNNDFESSRKLKGFLLIFYSTVFILAIIVGSLMSLFFSSWFSIGLSPEEIIIGKELVIITMMNVAVTLFFGLYSKILLAYERFALLKTLDIAKIFLRVGISVVILILGGRSISIAIVNLICSCIFGIITMFISNAKSKIKPIFKLKDFDFLREIGSYTFFVFIQMIATQINTMTDHVLLGIFSTSIIIAIYQVASLLSQYFQQISNAVNGVLQPGAVRLIENNGVNGKIIEKEMTKIGRIVFMMLGLIYIVFLVNGSTFIHLWVGDGYEKSFFAALIILFPLVFTLPQRIGTNLLWALNKHKIQALVSITVAIINIGTSIVFIIFLDDIIGAAIGTAIATITGDFIMMNYIFKKEMKVRPLIYNYGIVKNTWLCLLASTTIGLLLSLVNFSNIWIAFVSNCLIMVTSFLILMYLFGFNDYEKKILMSFLKRGNL